MRAVLAALVALTALGTAEVAAAEDRLTPEGPSTIRAMWTGASTAEGRGPEVITRWSVTVAPGGQAGRVRLRVLEPSDRATVKGTGPWVWLPAEPGTYEFPAPHVPYDYRDSGLALDQEVGGHALITFHADDPAKDEFSDLGELYHLDVFRPLLAEDARDVERTERRKGEQLRIQATIEPDSDRDGRGDKTEETGDPDANVVTPKPNLTLTAVEPLVLPDPGAPGLTVTVESDQPATVLVAARIAGVRLARKVLFTSAGTRSVRLTAKGRADRRRIRRALRRRGQLRAIVSADAGGGATARQRIVVRR